MISTLFVLAAGAGPMPPDLVKTPIQAVDEAAVDKTVKPCDDSCQMVRAESCEVW